MKAVEMLVQKTGCDKSDVFEAFPIVCRNDNAQLATTLLDMFRELSQMTFALTGLLVAVKKGHTKFVEAVSPYFTQVFSEDLLAPHLYRATKKGFWTIADALISIGWFPSQNRYILKI